MEFPSGIQTWLNTSGRLMKNRYNISLLALGTEGSPVKSLGKMLTQGKKTEVHSLDKGKANNKREEPLGAEYKVSNPS